MTEQGSLDRVPAAPDLPALAESGFAGLLAWAAQTRPEAPALEAEGDETVTRAELAARVAAVAGRLTDSGVTRGSVVGMALDNRVRSYVLVLAAATLGATILPLNPGFRAAELEALTELASPSHLVAVTEFTRSHAACWPGPASGSSTSTAPPRVRLRPPRRHRSATSPSGTG